MEKAVIVEAARPPVGQKNGSLSAAHPTELLAQLLIAVLLAFRLRRWAGDWRVYQQSWRAAMNVTRTAWLTAGLPAGWCARRSIPSACPDNTRRISRSA